MPLPNLNNVLLNPKAAMLLTKLDDPRSMTMVASRDGFESVARANMERRRSKDGAREAFIEEILATIIWGFGIGFIQKQIYNPFVKRATPIHFPDLLMTKLEPGPQQITRERIQKWAHPEDAAHLLEIAENPRMRQLYQTSNIAKFVSSTFIPILVLVFGVTQFNQWFTRKKVREEKTNHRPDFRNALHMPSRRDRKNDFISAPNYAQLGVFPTYLDSPPARNYAQLGMFPTYLDKIRQAVKTPQNPAASQLSSFHTQNSSSQNSGFDPAGTKNIRFGNAITQSISLFLANERSNTMIVDGVISGGRLAQARNRYERIERIIMEVGKVFGFYILADLVQRMVTPLVDRLLGTVSNIPFYGLNTLYHRYQQNPDRFLKDYHQSKFIFDGLPVTQGMTKAQEKKAMAAFEEKFVDNISAALRHPDKHTPNLFYDLSQELGWIPTKKFQGKVYPDLTQPVEFEKILQLRGLLADAVEKVESKGTSFLKELLTRSLTGRLTAFLAGNAICIFFLAYILPMAQQYVTFLMTGKKQFPGTMDME